jgi:hypothetical protein
MCECSLISFRRATSSRCRTRSPVSFVMPWNAPERFKDRGNAKLIECADAALAERIANAKAMKGYCLRAGDHYLVVPSNREQHFRKELEKLGYIPSF